MYNPFESRIMNNFVKFQLIITNVLKFKLNVKIKVLREKSTMH